MQLAATPTSHLMPVIILVLTSSSHFIVGMGIPTLSHFVYVWLNFLGIWIKVQFFHVIGVHCSFPAQIFSPVGEISHLVTQSWRVTSTHWGMSLMWVSSIVTLAHSHGTYSLSGMIMVSLYLACSMYISHLVNGTSWQSMVGKSWHTFLVMVSHSYKKKEMTDWLTCLCLLLKYFFIQSTFSNSVLHLRQSWSSNSTSPQTETSWQCWSLWSKTSFSWPWVGWLSISKAIVAGTEIWGIGDDMGSIN